MMTPMSVEYKVLTFPFKLYCMLEAAENDFFDDVVSWLPNGDGFKVHNIDVFTKTIMNRFFEQTKYKSFQRQLNLYEFSRIKTGPLQGAYTHQLLVRGNSSLCQLMIRHKTKQPGSKSLAGNKISKIWKSNGEVMAVPTHSFSSFVPLRAQSLRENGVAVPTQGASGSKRYPHAPEDIISTMVEPNALTVSTGPARCIMSSEMADAIIELFC